VYGRFLLFLAADERSVEAEEDRDLTRFDAGIPSWESMMRSGASCYLNDEKSGPGEVQALRIEVQGLHSLGGRTSGKIRERQQILFGFAGSIP
jgi:hypothetical protein